MLDLDRIEGIRLSANPWFQKAVALTLLAPNYHTPPFVRIAFEGADDLPSEPVIFAMNHTDRYNYWPLQYKLWLSLGRYTAAWVKGKYYEHPLMGKFMELVNSIPTVSRGYLISRDFKTTLGRRPSDEEYIAARGWVDAQAARVSGETVEPPADGFPDEILTRARSILGRVFDPVEETWAECVNGLFQTMMRRFVELNAEATEKGLDTIIFPEGTRSIRLSRGHIGLAQIALAQRRTIVPVGCNGCDRLYPGGSPVARGGEVVYRFGEPMTHEQMAPYHVDEAFEPFSPAAEVTHRQRFQGLVDRVMGRIDELLDERHRVREDRESEGVKGISRFV